MSIRVAAGFDIETTGLKAEDGHRTIEIALQLWDVVAKEQKFSWRRRINPMRSISADAQRVHGITLSELAAEPEFVAVAPLLVKLMDRCEFIVAHNGIGFDLPFINCELKMNGQATIAKPVFDTMLHGRWATAMGKVPNLGELCFACDVPYDTSLAHAADYDVDVMMKSFFRAVEWGFFDLAKLEVVH